MFAISQHYPAPHLEYLKLFQKITVTAFLDISVGAFMKVL